MEITEKRILKKINEWGSNWQWVTGIYRLFIYLPWNKIPEKYRESDEFKKTFPQDVIDKWDDNISTSGLEKDLGEYIKAIFTNLIQKQPIKAFGLVPILCADLFVLGHKVGGILGNLSEIINDYLKVAEQDRDVASAESMVSVAELLRKIILKYKIPTKYLVDDIVEMVYKSSGSLLATPAGTTNILESVDKAIDEYEKSGGTI